MNELFMLMQLAGQNPQAMAPILDALGPQFAPERVIPGLNMLPGSGTNVFAPPLPAGPDAYAPPSASTTAPPITPPPESGVGIGMSPVGGPPAPAPTDAMAMIMSMLAPGAGQGMAPPSAPAPGAPPPGAPAPTGRPQAPPSTVRPTAAQPVWSGGVTGSQKAPELGIQQTTGGTPAQLLLQAILGGGRAGGLDPLRVPTLGALLGGAR